MKKYYRCKCKECGNRFQVNKFKKMGVLSLDKDVPINLEMDIENVVQNNYHQEIRLPNGEIHVIDLKEIGLFLRCSNCNKSNNYSLRELVITDRLD